MGFSMALNDAIGVQLGVRLSEFHHPNTKTKKNAVASYQTLLPLLAPCSMRSSMLRSKATCWTQNQSQHTPGERSLVARPRSPRAFSTISHTPARILLPLNLISVSRNSVTLNSAPPHNERGYARVHSSIYKYTCLCVGPCPEPFKTRIVLDPPMPPAATSATCRAARTP